jgi:hypothetical protein
LCAVLKDVRAIVGECGRIRLERHEDMERLYVTGVSICADIDKLQTDGESAVQGARKAREEGKHVSQILSKFTSEHEFCHNLPFYKPLEIDPISNRPSQFPEFRLREGSPNVSLTHINETFPVAEFRTYLSSRAIISLAC